MENISTAENNKKRENKASVGGFKDSRGEWRPEKPVSYAPIFTWPPKVKQFFVWLFNYLFTWNLVYLAVVIFSYYYLQPPLEEMKSFRVNWIATILLRNMALVWIVYGGWHLYLYKFKARGTDAKYSPRWQSKFGSTFLWNDQVYDNVFWTCVSGVPVWTAYEVLTFWLYANDKIPYLDFREQPVYFIILFLLVPFWREFHFYLIHRLIHWKPLYNKIHYLHHYNINPGPWSGLAMHPLEHLMYFSVVLIHYVVPSHPLHFLFNSQHTALTPAPGHTGFEGKVFKILPFGSYFHYLHHRLFDCNYGESTIPMDKWFGVFEDGSQTQTEKQMAAAAYQKLMVTRIVDESPEVKSIYFTSTDNSELKKNLAGQHLTFKIPFQNNELSLDADKRDGNQIKYAIRNYTISNVGENNQYRISVKKEPEGLVSSALFHSLKPGHQLQAKGPKGSFVHHYIKGKSSVFIAAGIGITPILSMLKSISKTTEDIYLILAVKEKNRLCFQQEIRQICTVNPTVKVHVFLSQESQVSSDITADSYSYHYQRTDISSLKSILPKGKHFNFYICGPENMTTSLIKEITTWKGKQSPVHTESFGQNNTNINPVDSKKIIQVHFLKSNKTVEWDPEYRNLLEFAESNDIPLEAGCMFGECGACSTKVVSGSFGYNYETATKPDKGNCLPCSCHPISDLTLDA
jgi:ferredoxin-NADP reductase/sterol desaturase/sphingolipid hydroxylase (fatty acid hydroxylase superfamily)